MKLFQFSFSNLFSVKFQICKYFRLCRPLRSVAGREFHSATLV
jgi:hypothetical protein